MKKSFHSPYFKWGLTAFAVIAFSICFFFAVFKMDNFFAAIGKFFGILKPFIYGATVAYFLLPINNLLERRFRPLLTRIIKSKIKVRKWSKRLASLISVTLLLVLASALLSLVLPQLVTSILSLTNFMPNYLAQISDWLERFLQDSPVLRENLMQIYHRFSAWMMSWVENQMLPKLIQVMGGSLLGTVNMLKDVVVGVVIAIYALNSKDLFAAQSKKISYSLLSTEHANLFIKNMRFVHRVFSGFITGNLLVSLVIGIITFVFMNILSMPYAILISVIIGTTNFIPFFGPIIGAIPCSLIILMVDPLQCLYFVVFILVLQQIDGNIISPKILGDSTGLSSFWVMFAILIAGGLFGFAGMALGVPLFAVFYSLIASLVNRSLCSKSMPTKTKDYFYMDHITTDTRTPVYFATERPSPENGISLKPLRKNEPK